MLTAIASLSDMLASVPQHILFIACNVLYFCCEYIIGSGMSQAFFS